jgi:hypothetical protein
MSAYPSHRNSFLQLANLENAYTPHHFAECEAESVTVSAGDILPLLIDAAQSNRAWLEDFQDESLEISQELYEVLLAYKRLICTSQPRVA